MDLSDTVETLKTKGGIRMKTKFVGWISIFLLLLNLTACGNAPQMPMEIMVDGYKIEIGKTIMQDLIDLGYEVHSSGRQDVAKDGDKYISFYYSLDKGAGHQFWVTVLVPWSGSTDISAEQSSSVTEGIVRGVIVSKSAAEDITVTYNDVDLTEMSFDQATDWGAKEDADQSVKTYKLTAAQGFLRWEAENTLHDDFDELSIQMSMSAFEKMQNE